MTIAGAFPPSSKETFVTFLDAASIIFIPVGTLPVKLTMPTFSFPAKAFPISEPEPDTKLNTPFGKPISSTNLANSKALFGVSELGLITIVFPVTSAGASFLAIRKNGKFQGKIPAATPIGSLNKNIFSFGLSLWIISPS